MSDTEPSTLIHYEGWPHAEVAPCGAHVPDDQLTTRPGEVTCFACRANTKFKAAQRGEEGIGEPTPLAQRTAPKPLKDIIAGDPDLTALAGKAFDRARNERGMYVIEEFIHHGDYRSTRRVEVYAINAVTVDAVVQSSAYGYGSWLDPNGPYPEARRPKLFELVEDLKAGRTNRQIGWSTFRLITDH